MLLVQLAPYLLWNALEVNIVIIAACIPTLRPLCLVVFKQKGAEAYGKKSYQMTPKSSSGNRWRIGKVEDDTESLKSINRNGKDVPLVYGRVCPGSSSGNGSRDGDRDWDAEAQKPEANDDMRSKSSSGIMQNIEVQVISYDGRQREAQHVL